MSKPSWILYDRRKGKSGTPAEGTLGCLHCGAHEEVDALASVEEGTLLRDAFAAQHKGCGDEATAARRVFGPEPASSAFELRP